MVAIDTGRLGVSILPDPVIIAGDERFGSAVPEDLKKI